MRNTLNLPTGVLFFMLGKKLVNKAPIKRGLVASAAHYLNKLGQLKKAITQAEIIMYAQRYGWTAGANTYTATVFAKA